jgi:predicted enzyme related to lactoylglutathione lyase
MSGRVVHFEIPYDDGDRARAFYKDAFGWNIMHMPEMSYTLVSTGPTSEEGPPTEPGFINGGMMMRSDSLSSSPVVVIDVPDINDTLSRVESLGGATLQVKQPVGDMGFAAYFKDSEGNVVGLWQSAQPAS